MIKPEVNNDFKDEIILELKKQNEKLFELHREKLEEEIKTQMTYFFNSLAETNVRQNTESLDINHIISTSKSRPQSSYFNSNSNNIYYDYNDRPHTSQGLKIRASIEPAVLEASKRPVTVSTTTGRSENNPVIRKKHLVQEIYEKMVDKDEGKTKASNKPIFKTSKNILHPSHLAEKYNVPIFPIKIKKKKKNTLSDTRNDEEIYIKNKHNDDDKYISQMDRATQLMIRKSESFIKEGVKAKKYRMKREKQYEKWLQSESNNINNDNDNIENDNDNISDYDNNYENRNISDDKIIEENSNITNIPVEKVILSQLQPSYDNSNKVESSQYYETKEESLNENNINPLSPRWTQQKVTGVLPDFDLHTKSEWENSLARYILSVFASKTRATFSTSQKAMKSDDIVDFVDISRRETVNSVVHFMEKNESIRQGTQRPSTTGSNFRKRFESINSTNSISFSRPQSASVKPVYEANEKFRRNMKVRNDKGEEVTVRTAARVTPIWFVSAGDVYADWTALPDGQKLQAQLSSFYEHRKFLEYLQVLEKVLLELWEKIYPIQKNEQFFLDKRYSCRQTVRECLQSRNRSRSKTTSSPSKDISYNSFTVTDDWTTLNSKDESSFMKTKTTFDTQFVMEHWRRLIVTANAISILCVEKNRFDIALHILNKIGEWLKREDILPTEVREELLAHVSDTRSYYFYKSQKYGSALFEIKKARKIHEKYGNTEEYNIGLLRIATIECMKSEFKEAHKRLYEFLTIIEDGKMGLNHATAKQLCLVAIAYHNLAVIQLKLQVPDLAVRSSQSARKIARLCLSYSNRWIQIFQWTHDAAVDDVNFLLSLHSKGLNEEQTYTIKELLNTAFAPD